MKRLIDFLQLVWKWENDGVKPAYRIGIQEAWKFSGLLNRKKRAGHLLDGREIHEWPGGDDDN